MNREEIKEDYKSLLKVGFTLAQIERLSKFRSDYIVRKQQKFSAELHRLEFLRWLVSTGRLFD